MRIAIVGGGPGGLYIAALMKQLDPAHEITVWERNAPDDTFGFGVVFSDETLGGIENADTVVHDAMENRFARWTDIDIEFNGHPFTVGGQGFAAMSRKDLLRILQERSAELGVTVHYRTTAPDVDELRESHDLVVAADGLNSAVRTKYADTFGPDLDRRANKYMWLGTDRVFEAFQFFVRQTEFGTMQIHGYPYSDSGSTFIVEMAEDVWRRAGFDATEGTEFPPGVSDEQAVARIREIFAEELTGHALLTNNSKWLNFTTVRNERWHHRNVVLLGDAAHTAHFSIGSGTKLAMEDALALAACLHEHPTVDEALTAYETERRPVVESTQRAAQASLEWFENIGRYAGQDPAQFCFNLLTRSRRITFDNLRDRDPGFAELIERGFAKSQGLPETEATPAMFQPFSIGGLELKNRIVLSPMDMYSAVNGVPDDFHLVHLGSKALGGAGLVMTEMVCVSPEARITPGCTGLWNDAQRDAWSKVTSFVHERSTAKIGLQLGHAGRKGSTKVMWEGIDQPLDEGNWAVVGPSPLPYGAGCHMPREMTRQDMDAVVADFAAAARRAAEAGFDLLEVHAAHGYLLSSFLSAVANHRTDEYGGALTNRLRFPLEVFDAVRAAFPAERPVTVRISATDWSPDGNTEHDAVEIARAFVAHGAAAIDVSSGQVTKDEKPAFGRSYQTPFADRIRHEVAAPADVAVIAVGAISSYDDVNSILLAGRADLCALGRTHLYNPQWTLQAAAEQEYRGPGAEWPAQFAAGRRRPPTSRTDAVRPRLALLRDTPRDAVHLRWTPSRTTG
ncbi:bifunctional salicylyl-CoA 5-hydroxylase/oxidoreductase [Streptomyces sp. NBC_00882]|uniref:bifunctional salicylyl-CoA 5-hydroxylase/oxidoreductase n=1 Tax=Streptomyces sp. NBC_00882 TaxID=2975856 RepID=UPI00386A2D66|nr:bifunctional salicylyl-CoA 5-hydroxylase/oxidoreductase [Streptomyces canus]WSZ29514.1 bifunctional salicylyl-CoA 5-hydroxylase/oxidoreductase [Streptomyces sp. NBC_00882]